MRIFEMSPRHRTPQIRMINLVDILLNLLIFFIASTTFRAAYNTPNAVKVTLPEARTAEEIGKDKVAHMSIKVTLDDKIYLDDQPVGLNDLENSLRNARAKNPEVLLEFSGDEKASYGTVMQVVDAARAAGIRNITAFTQKPVSSSPKK
jgi:biopolymer transport protein ExbD